MASSSALPHPLHLDLHGQTQAFLRKVSPSNAHASLISSTKSTTALLNALSNALADPSLTLLIEDYFRPILFDLCARWITLPALTEDQLVAICLLVEVHEEIFPILYRLFRRPELKDGLLLGCPIHASDKHRVNRLLLAYYRILQANRELPAQLCWSLTPLTSVIWSTDFDNASRLLALRCYALQSGMGEAQRNEIEAEIFGELCGPDCPLYYESSSDGQSVDVDGWIMPVLEVRRIQDARVSIATSTQNYFAEEASISASDICPLVADIEGVLLLRSSDPIGHPSQLIRTDTSNHNLRTLAHRVSLRVPILLTSPPSTGKSILLSHLATCLFPQVRNQLVTVHLADTSLDPRSLIGSYVSSVSEAGTFEWKEGVLVRAMRQGKWIVFKDIDRGSPEVLGIIKPLVESYRSDKWIGGCASLDVSGRGRVIAHQDFAIFATRSVAPSRNVTFPPPLFLGAHKFLEVTVASPSLEDLQTIISSKFPRLDGAPTWGFIRMWQAIMVLGTPSSMRTVGLRELEKYCTRVDALLPPSFQPGQLHLESSLSASFTSVHFREQMFLQARDVFFGAAALTGAAQGHINSVIEIVAKHLGLERDRRDWLLKGWAPELKVEKDVNDLIIGLRSNNVFLSARPFAQGMPTPPSRPFAMHRPAILLLSQISTAVSLIEPVLLTGETGTGKTSVVTHLASLLRKPLISLNLSHQTESADLLGGFKPIDARVPASGLQERFLELFGSTFSRRKNEKFENEVRKAVNDGKWRRAAGLWKESAKLAKDRIRARTADTTAETVDGSETKSPRKRRKVDGTPEAAWNAFENDVGEFEIHHVHGRSKFAFDFVEGPLVKALRDGDWVLLDEINMASSETLECISTLLQSATSSITLTEEGSLEPIPRHPDFRLFACMNPATDVGKKDLPPNIRCRFTEIDVPPPDANKDTLISIITKYIGHVAIGDNKSAIMDIAEFYVSVKQLSESRAIADGANHRPHFSMRTLARALTFAADIASMYGLRRAIWEGCLMAFTMALDVQSIEAVTALAQKHLLAGVRNSRSALAKIPAPPSDDHLRFGPFYLERGPLPVDSMDEYIITPSVEAKLIDLSRILLTRRFPVLIEGPTSSGKTSSVEYLAKRTGHQFVRINNHEHTDIQEYLGSYVADPLTGKLMFQDGLLVRALRFGHWIVLDELNLAPTDVLEALNRLLDDNRELVIPETQEVVRPHPHFMIFATQNPPGLYAGRKVLSRAFRNRFLEVHFEDVPEAELETILCQRSRIAPSYGKKIVSVFRELQNRRQSGRVFESKFGFATLRDLFRWANRDAMSYQELANNGYMLLAERARRADDKIVVKEVIEKAMGVSIDEAALYSLHNSSDLESFLGCVIPTTFEFIWTRAMQRLFILLSRALRFNEPVLLVGETGCGKTSVCQIFAQANGQRLHTLNCHQGTETADLIGGLRPLRNRPSLEADILRDAVPFLQQLGIVEHPLSAEALAHQVTKALKLSTLDSDLRRGLDALHLRLGRLNAIFQWQDGPLVEAMVTGDLFLLDEISLADDSVLERLNSVLEPSRTLVLAEKGGDTSSGVHITGADTFKLVATMNPGGDYGKKELSPALRNRFTEIWVPSVDNRDDLELIVNRTWKHEELRSYTHRILDFVDWLCARVGDRSLMNLRDLIAWVQFSNAAFSNGQGLSEATIFHHAAQMTFLDGLASLPQLSDYRKEAIQQLKDEASLELHRLAPGSSSQTSPDPSLDPSLYLQLGPFAIPRGCKGSDAPVFHFKAPTTGQNVMRVIRASQLLKPILLEGSPGVGKTSLITALAQASGHELCRINLSDQTDLVDLFGSDLPVEGGAPGEFAWRDAEFLKALLKGHWVLLDEMNLAPQAVLEGLNSVLDHRGTVFVPELGRSFVRHPSFRIFAAQNPLSQGSGRKGLPKSFLNRFTKVYVEELSPSDLHLICCHLFPDMEPKTLESMVAFNTHLSLEVTSKRTFGRDGSPWEFNLRDVIRWGKLVCRSASRDPLHSLRAVYLHRFRAVQDRLQAGRIFDKFFNVPSTARIAANPSLYLSSRHCQIGVTHLPRNPYLPPSRSGRVLKAQLTALEAVGVCVSQSWLSIVTGPRQSGKTQLVRLLANITGNSLHELSLSSATEAADILGSFEQVDGSGRIYNLALEVSAMCKELLRGRKGCGSVLEGYDTLQTLISVPQDPQAILSTLSTLVATLEKHSPADLDDIRERMTKLRSTTQAQFEWLDGPLVEAMKHGYWLLLDGANLCNPSVLDRLNSVCEMEGTLVLNERGHVNGNALVIKPHQSFRLFMTADPQYGEISRAMRNRGIEVTLLHSPTSEYDSETVCDYLRIPHLDGIDISAFDASRRGLQVTSPRENTLVAAAGLPFLEDSGLSHLLDHAPRLLSSLEPGSISPDALRLFLGRSTVPAFKPHVVRFLQVVQPLELQYIHQFIQSHARVGGVLAKMRACRVMREVHSILSPVQPFMCFDVEETLSGQDADKAQKTSLPLLDLLTMLALPKQSEASRVVPLSETQIRIEKVIIELSTKTQCTARALFDGEELPENSSQVCIEILRFSRLLEQTISQPYFDYSSLRAIADWLTAALAQRPLAFTDVESSAKDLSSLLALTTGYGLHALWSLFLNRPHISISSHDINAILRKLTNAKDARRQAFTMITLGLSGSTHEEVGLLGKLLDHTHENFEEASDSATPSQKSTDVVILLAELGILVKSTTSSERMAQFLDIICQLCDTSLLRVAAYQPIVWRSQASLTPALLQQQLLWMKDLTASADGASSLLRPSNLINTLRIANLKQCGMGDYVQHIRMMRRDMQLLLLQYEGGSDRPALLGALLQQSTTMIADAFAYPHGTVHLQSAYKAAEAKYMHDASFFVGTSSQAQLKKTGYSWIRFAHMLLHLVVPNIPVDPAVIQRCRYQYLQSQVTLLDEQLALHHHLDLLLTGNRSSPVVVYLQSQRDILSAEMEHLEPMERSDVSRLQMFWAEITQFSNVVTPSKIADLLTRLEGGEPMAVHREESIQESVHTLIQRLETAYTEFEDLTVLVTYALLHLRIGLRLVRHETAERMASDASEGYGQALTSFPSVKTSSQLVNGVFPTDTRADACPRQLLSLAAIAFETNALVLSESNLRTLHMVYDNVVRLWLLDLERALKEHEAAQSLYRRKDDSYEDQTDEIREERDFRSMFPSFEEDVLDEEAKSTNPAASEDSSQFVAPRHMERLLSIHFSILGTHSQDTEMTITSFADLRIQSLSSLDLQSLSEQLDRNLTIQLYHLHRHLPSSETNCKAPSADFYLDANVDELTKAVQVVSALCVRLVQLAEEWPDQMVLRHLMTRCEAILALPLDSPVARVLSALEQLLLHTEDWELFAHRHNNLQTERSALINLIVEWRRLELSCWDTLLTSEQIKFESGIYEWWFRLYDALFRGSVAAYEGEEMASGEDKLTSYLANLLPMLDEFIRDSPVGQFGSRMRLLASFENFCRLVTPTLPSAAHGKIFIRVQQLLKATHNSFDLYSSAISASLQGQRASLEKEVKNFIKLASWKDINVQALKQSAQRTHHQLFKIIRKFRDVLRGPVVAFLVPQSVSEAAPSDDATTLSIERSRGPIPSFPANYSHEGLAHLSNLDRTYSKFVDIVFGKIMPFISSLLPYHVEDLGSEIISSIENLSSTNIESASGEKRNKQLKALLVRKRKAWSDLLKELKRAGFSTNMTSESLRNQQDRRWLREQPSFPAIESFAFAAILNKSEGYFHRLEGALKNLRASVSGHHSDLTTRELQRGVMFLESCFSMALQSRARLALSTVALLTLRQLVTRLRTPKIDIRYSGVHVHEHVVSVSNLFRRLESALEEVAMSLDLINNLDSSATLVSLSGEVMAMKKTVMMTAVSVASVLHSVKLTALAFLTQDEVTVIGTAIDLIEHVKKTTQNWSQRHLRSRRIFEDVLCWLSSQTIPSLAATTAPVRSPTPDCESVINTCLIGVQNLLAKSPDRPVEDDDRDSYIRSDYRLVDEMTKIVNLSSVVDLANTALAASVSSPDHADSLNRFLPFLERYYEMAEDQLTLHAAWTKSLFKLSFILCSLLRSLAKEGFCKPPDVEDSEGVEDASGTVEGSGMGEGTGAKNVSNEIEDEHQVEGLKGQEEENEADETEENDDGAIEMANDFGGDMKDMPDTGSQQGDESEQEDEDQPDEQLGDLDTSDPDVVDEKLWGDEKGPEESGPEEQTGKDHSEQHAKDSEVAAKDESGEEHGEEKKTETQKSDEGSDKEEVPEEQAPKEQDPATSGAPMDEHIPEADTLDLPDDIDLGMGEDVEENERDEDVDMDEAEDGPLDEQEKEGLDEQTIDEGHADEESHGAEDGQSDVTEDVDEGEKGSAEAIKEDDQSMEDAAEEGAPAPPDLGQGDDSMQSDVPQNADSTEPRTAADANGSDGSGGGQVQQNTTSQLDHERVDGPEQQTTSNETDTHDDIGEGGSGVQQGQQPQSQTSQTASDPRRSLGDALKEARQTFNEILQSQPSRDKSDLTQNSDQLEYIQQDDEDQEMQALGPSGEEQTARLKDLKIVDEETSANEDMPMDVDEPEIEETHHQVPQKSTEREDRNGKEGSTDQAQGAIMSQPSLHSSSAAAIDPDTDAHRVDADMDASPLDEEVEVQLRLWQESGGPIEGAEHMWRLYASLTHDLAYALCEQLRLILEPTLATRLKGDYRTGKRLNMRKIIPYIASDFTKDKIWLRRTRPSQREYQVLIALDDSRSMSESHSVHLAYQTMALVSKALTRLEAGDIGIAKFGQTVDILHGFTDGPFTDQTGIKVISSFRFDQKATNVLSLVDRSLQVLEKARENRSTRSSSAADLWQLEVIISDGICQDHEKLRSVLRKAEEQRIMIVFIIIDSLDAQQGSIYTMEKADFQNVDGRMELKLNRYLDTFPFEYYVVLRDVEALPGVLATTLKQFFERVTEE